MLYNILKYIFNTIFTNILNNIKYNKYNKYINVLEFIPSIQEKIINQDIDINDKLIKTIKNFCIKNLKQNKKAIVSLSGGVDSMVLTTILVLLNYEVICLHINYNNREESNEEQEFLENWCLINNIKLYVNSIVDIKRKNTKRSDYEYESKKIRFNFYQEIMQEQGIDNILLGHHKDDIIENIFANVCRGRYILDLAVIRDQTIINNVTILRPLIDFYKTSIYAFAEKYQVPYFKDTTPKWSVRGKYRNEIYPILEDTFSYSIKSNLLGISKQSYEWNELVSNKIIEPFLKTVTFNDRNCVFYVEQYKDYAICFWNVVFMKIFYKYGKNCPSRKAINVFIKLIQTKNVAFISLSDSCICRNKNYEITIDFK
jgi:tRNA(Ile)-lysidine synthetase-like protein